MFLAAVAAIAASMIGPPPPSPSVSVQATAIIRIISGVQLHFGEQPKAGADVPPVRETKVKIGDTEQPARLTEFQ